MASGKELEIEEALDAAGSWGRYQKLILLLTLWASIPNNLASMHFIFSQYEPQHHCTFPEEFLNFNDTGYNSSERRNIVSTILPLEWNQEHELIRSECKMYDRNYSSYPVTMWTTVFKMDNDTRIVKCKSGITFNSTQKTAATEFSMVCDGDWKAPLSVSMRAIGLTFGSILGVTADWYGRRTLFIISNVVQILGLVICVSAWNYPVFCLSTIIVGMSGLINFVMGFVLVTEITVSKWRNFIAIGSFFAYGVGYLVLTLTAYIWQDNWRWLIGAVTVITTVIYIPCSILFPESPRWLAQKGRSEDAIKYLRMIAKINRKKEKFEEALEDGKCKIISKQNITSTGIVETCRIFLRSGIAGRFIATVYGWFVTSTVYYAISLYSTDFSDDIYINTILNGVSEIPAYIAVYFLSEYFGRPRTAWLLMWTTGCASIILPFIPQRLHIVITIFAILGKGSIAAAFYLWYLISSEVVPTLQRSSSMGICSAAARTGAFCAPYLMHIRRSSSIAPNMIMGVLAITSGLIGLLFIPETAGISVPDFAAEAKKNNRIYRLNLFKSFLKKEKVLEKHPESEREMTLML